MTTKKTQTKKAKPTHQETATFRFLPFSVDLFSRRELRLKRAEMLPVGRVDDLTLQVIEAMEQVIVRGTLAFLCRQGGWKSLNVARTGQEQPLNDMRLTDERVQQYWNLSYGDESLDTLIIAYNAVCQAAGQTPPVERSKGRRRGSYPTSKGMSFRNNGDMFVHHIAWENVRSAPFKIDKRYWDYFTRNPLTKLARLDAEQRPEEVIERLLRDDIEPVLPWFGSRFAQCWSRELETRWKTLERFHRLNTGMVTYFQALLEVARNKNRRDLLIPILNFFQDHFQGDNIEDLWQKEFNRLARDLRFADRDTYRRTWGSAIRMGWTLYEEYGEARSIHPIDRESADRVFMEVFEKQEFEQTAERARVLSNALNSVIS